MAGLYIHVPFCGSICSYCHFSRTADHQPGVRRRYVDAVIGELERRRETCSVLDGSRLLETVYLGGGTPSQLEPELMTRLLEGTVGRLPCSPDLELTAEANPETFTEDTARAWRAAGVNRVSLGVQSLNEEVLRLLGRACGPGTARAALARACRHFDRVSADWILGPGLKDDALLKELQEALDLGVEHFSVYILELHAGTDLERRVAQGKVGLLPDEETERQYLAVARFLAEQGIEQYEVSNFARPGQESRHNRNYWRRVPFLGLGPSASGGYGRRRYRNEADIPAYCEAVEGGQIPEAATDGLDLAVRRTERAMLALRTANGVPVTWLKPVDLNQGVREGLWSLGQGKLRLTGRGFLMIDTIEEWLLP